MGKICCETALEIAGVFCALPLLSGSYSWSYDGDFMKLSHP
jgi:hypothetical protein